MARNRELTEFDEIYNHYHNAVYGNILRIVKDAVYAEDILQDVFLAYWENRLTLVPESVGGWLFTVSYNKSVKHLQRTKRMPIIAEYNQHDIFEEAEHSAEFEAGYTAKIKMIEVAVAHLPSRLKEAYSLCRLEGKSPEEAASRMNISVQSVQDYLKQSNKYLKSYIMHQNVAKTFAILPLLIRFFQ